MSALVQVRLETLIEHIKTLEAQAEKAAGPWPGAESAGKINEWHKRRRDEGGRIAKVLRQTEGASIRERWDGCVIRMGGIRASSTSGIYGALANWKRAAERKIERVRA